MQLMQVDRYNYAPLGELFLLKCALETTLMNTATSRHYFRLNLIHQLQEENECMKKKYEMGGLPELLGMGAVK